MVARAEKLSAGDLCKCGHWASDHIGKDGPCAAEIRPKALVFLVPPDRKYTCRCEAFAMAVHPAELRKGARS